MEDGDNVAYLEASYKVGGMGGSRIILSEILRLFLL